MHTRSMLPQRPSENRLIARLKSAGYVLVREDRKAGYYAGMMRLVGGLTECAFLRDPALLRVLSHAQVKKDGTAHTARELKDIAQPGTETPRFYDTLHDLVAQGIFLRGYRLKCPACDLETWYESVGESMPCAGCRLPFQPPLSLDFAYRLNRLWSVGLNQGGATVLLALLWLADRCDDLHWLLSAVVRRAGTITDLDVVASCDDTLYVIECKNREHDPPHEQLRQVATIAADLDARCLYATLEVHTPVTAVRLLTYGDLMA